MNRIEYFWADGKLKWIDGAIREWNCIHVSKCDVLVDTPDGMYDWNTDYEEPKLPYRYVYLEELFEFLSIRITDPLMKTRGPFELCNCLKK